MQLLQTIQADYEPGTYVLDGTLASGGSSLAISTSAHAIRVYDLHRTTFLFDLRQHTHRITDLVSSAAQPSTLFSSQEDSGVMISDLRQAKAAHFLNEMQNHGVTCNSISVSPSGLHLAIATDGDVHIVDTRMWQSVRHMEQIHIDEVTRVRYLEEAVLCSASEDQMVNFTTTAEVVEDDVLLQAINTGDVMTRMTCFPEHMCVAMVSSCENGYLCPLDLEQREVKVPRPNYNTYLVDWCVVGGQLTLVMGERDDDGNPTTLSVLPWMGTPASSSSTSSTPVQLQAVHRDIGRVALGFGDRLITGGEDGLLAFWSANTTAQEQHTASISSSVRGGVKEHTTTSSHTAGGAAQAPHTQGGTVPWKAGGGGGRGPAKRGKPY